MTGIRAFIAVDLPGQILDQLGKIIQSLHQDIQNNSIRWVPVKNIHLTLMFLGDIDPSNLNEIPKILSRELETCSQFVIRVGGLGAFPSIKKPRVIWVGVDYPASLKTIYETIQQRIGDLGYQRDERPFSPHLTLGRLSRHGTPDEIVRVSRALQSQEVGFMDSALIDRVHMYRSDLRPDGAVYTKLHSVKLQP